ncbi:hypothetical protein MRX96_001407 [Rhipicephalus microplus]
MDIITLSRHSSFGDFQESLWTLLWARMEFRNYAGREWVGDKRLDVRSRLHIETRFGILSRLDFETRLTFRLD